MNRIFFLYCFKLIALYCLFFYGTQIIIGLAAPGGYYQPFIAKYFNYPAHLRNALLSTSKAVSQLLGYKAEIYGQFKIRFINGAGVRIVYSCLGVGLISFWSAFVLANNVAPARKAGFIIIGVLAIFSINVTRIVLLLIAANKGYKIPYGIEHHTLFNIFAYLLIIVMIIIFSRSEKKYKERTVNKNNKIGGT